MAEAKLCLTCCNRVKPKGDWDENGGDWWQCTAAPILPAFTGQFIHGGNLQLVNLASFREGHPCAEYQNAKECALWEQRASETAHG